MSSRIGSARGRLAGAMPPVPRSALIRRAGLLLGLLSLATASGAQAATLTVTRTDDPASPTCTVGNCTLRAAIKAANVDGTSDTIQIPPGEYQLSAGGLPITASMTLVGAGAHLTSIFAAPASQIMMISGSGAVTLQDMKLDGAKVFQEGAAVRGSGSVSIAIRRAIISHNESKGGLDGGGVYDSSTGPLLIEASTLNNNSAKGGGALDGTSPITVINSTLTANIAENDGGAIEVSKTTLINDTITGNKCGNGSRCGGGVNAIKLESGVAISARDTILAGNTDGEGALNNCLAIGGSVEATIGATGPNLENGTDCNFKSAGGLEGNPLLGPLDDNGGPTPTMLPGSGSPAINAGKNCAAEDQRRGARPAPGGGQCDIGAVEVNSLADIAIAGHATPTAVAFGGSIEYILTATNRGPDPALKTTVENVLPAGATFERATSAAGSCSGSTTLACSLGTLDPGVSATITVFAKLGQAGTATDSARASAPATDASPADNQVSILASVAPSPIVVGPPEADVAGAANSVVAAAPNSPPAAAIVAEAPSLPFMPLTPVLSGLTISPASFAVASAPTALVASPHTPRGTTFGFTLSEPARVRIALRRKVSGRQVGGLCLVAGANAPHGPHCTRLVLVGTLQRAGTPGVNRIAFSGRLGSRPLRTGNYVATLVATATGTPASVPARRGFSIVR